MSSFKKIFSADIKIFYNLILLLLLMFFFMSLSFLVNGFVFKQLDTAVIFRVKLLLQQLFTFGIPPLILAVFLKKRHAHHWLRLTVAPKPLQLLLVFLLSFSLVPVVNYIGELNSHFTLPERHSAWMNKLKEMDKLAEDATITLLSVKTWGLVLLNILVVGLLPGLSEELFFRGAMQRIVSDTKNIHYAIWVVAIVFSAIHFQYSGFIPRMLLGALFGYFVLWSGSLWLSVFAHFLNNFLLVVAFSLFNNGITSIDSKNIGLGNQWWLVILSGVISLILINLLYKSRKRN